MGDKPCELELLSDPSQVFQYNEFTNVNYEDPNLNVSIPMFAISGNHDDSSGDQLLTPMDLLHVSGLLNHFGKTLVTDKIQLTPLLFQKGTTKLALYGLQSIREERLFRTFKEGGVTFDIPTVRDGEWFNLMCLHQNHTGHTNTAFLPEQFLPEFMDLIIWGHEHECIPNFMFNPIKKFNVLQPGSSIATSLCDAEARDKFVFILEINGSLPTPQQQVKLIPVPLTTVRTFKLRNLSLSDYEDEFKPHEKDKISQFLTAIVEQMIKEANEETKLKLNMDQFGIDNNNNENENGNVNDEDDELITLPMPLIRLKVDYSGPPGSTIDYQVENPRRFSNKFVGHVANVNNVIQFYKKSKTAGQNRRKMDKNAIILSNDKSNNADDINDEDIGIDSLINDMLNKMQLSLLPELGFNEAVKTFVDKDEKNALKKFIDQELINEVDILMTNRELIENENPDDIKLLMKEVKRSNAIQGNNSTHNKSSGNNNNNNISGNNGQVNNDDDAAADDDNAANREERKSVEPMERSIAPFGASVKSKRTNSIVRSDSIIISSDDEPEADNDLDHLITLSDDDESDGHHSGQSSNNGGVGTVRRQPRQRASGSAAPPRRSAGSLKRARSAAGKTTADRNERTPKTNLLRDFLAQKRK